MTEGPLTRAARERLAPLEGRPVADHAQEYEELHRALTAALSDAEHDPAAQES